MGSTDADGGSFRAMMSDNELPTQSFSEAQMAKDVRAAALMLGELALRLPASERNQALRTAMDALGLDWENVRGTDET